MTIHFNNNGVPISDFEVEDFYQNHKNDLEITISNYLVLNRFRLGVKQKEISEIELHTADVDGLYISNSTPSGCMDNWDAPILSKHIEICLHLC